MSTPPPDDPWGHPGSGPSGPPPPPGGGYGYPPPPPPAPPAPPAPGGGYPPPGGEYPPPGGYGYPPPPPDPGYPGGGYPGGGYPGGGYPGDQYPGGQYPGAKGWTPFGPATGWWRRVGATVIDSLILFIPIVVLNVAGGRIAGEILGIVLQAAYITIMLSRRGQTVGNSAVGTRVVDATNGGPLSTGKAFGRWAAQFLFSVLAIVIIPLLLDILWPLWDRQNQTLHDKMAGTLTLYTG